MVASPTVTTNIQRLAWSLSLVFLLHSSLSASTTATSRGFGESKESEAVASDFGQRLVAFHIKAVVPVESNPQCPGRYPVHMCTEADAGAVLEALQAARYVISPYGSSYFNSRAEYVVTPPIFPAEDPEAFYTQVADIIRTTLNARHSAERGVVSVESLLDDNGRRPRPMQAYIPGTQYARYLARRPVDGIGELPAGIPVDVLSIVMAAGNAEPAEREAMLRAAVNHSSARVHIEEFLRHVAARPDLFRGAIGETAAYMALLAAEGMAPEQVREHLGWTRRVALVRGWMANAAAQYNDVEGRESNEAFAELGAPSSKSRRGSDASSEASEIDSVVSDMSDVGSVVSRRSSRSHRSKAASARSHRDVPMVEAAAQRLDPIAESGEDEIAPLAKGAHVIVPVMDGSIARDILYMESCNRNYVRNEIIAIPNAQTENIHMVIAHFCNEIQPDLKHFLRKFPNLEFLCLNSCGLTSLPSDLLQNNSLLKVLILSNNAISEIPSNFFSYTKALTPASPKPASQLVWLDLSGNQLAHIAEDAGMDTLPNLQCLSLAYNPWLGKSPSSLLPITFLSGTHGLKILNVAGCGLLESFPEPFIKLAAESLVVLHAADSKLSSELRRYLVNKPSLLFASFPGKDEKNWYIAKNKEMEAFFRALLRERLTTVIKKNDVRSRISLLYAKTPFDLAEDGFCESHGGKVAVTRDAIDVFLSSYEGVRRIMKWAYLCSTPESERPQYCSEEELELMRRHYDTFGSIGRSIEEGFFEHGATLGIIRMKWDEVYNYKELHERREAWIEDFAAAAAKKVEKADAVVYLRADCARALTSLFTFVQRRFEALSKYCLFVGLRERALSEAEYRSIYARPEAICEVYKLFCSARAIVLSDEDKRVLGLLGSPDLVDDKMAFFSADARIAWQR
ncbi:MAG: hypothetical protein QG604_207, partial [Candidatus Dependentiae bacterium]|nr:hypothetical protein [Candidatus Dependentiae bacterium]